MQGRVKRKLLRRASEERELRLAENGAGAVTVCALCERTLGTRVEWHHPLPRSEGGMVTVPVHPICHRAIHAHVSNRELARNYPGMEALRARDDMQQFLRWIRSKPADFHAPTRRKRG